MSPIPACTVIRSFETGYGAGELPPILPTKICVARKTRGESGPLCRHYKKPPSIPDLSISVARFLEALSGEERKTAERERLHLRRALLYQDPTIHHQAGASDVTSVFGRKEDSGASQILRGT